MAHTKLVLALGMIAAASPVPAASDDRTGMTAPPGTSETRYCMRIEPITGTRVEQIKCWTREQWWVQGVDVDEDWAEEGVRTIG